MNLYLDDDCASRLLAQLLSAAGHDVQRPVMVNWTARWMHRT
jgi:thiol:disulfide interchange protein